MKVQIDPQTEAELKTDIQLQDEALQKQKKDSADKEAELIKYHEMTTALSSPPPPPELTAKDLKADLGGTFHERMQEEKSIYLTLNYGQRPVVTFTGFWNGKLVGNAMNAISRAYRVQKHKAIRANAEQPNQGDGDARN